MQEKKRAKKRSISRRQVISAVSAGGLGLALPASASPRREAARQGGAQPAPRPSHDADELHVLVMKGSHKKYEEFVEKLATDDDFRKTVVENPDGVLNKYGIFFHPSLKEELGNHKPSLASKEAIAKFHKDVKEITPSFRMTHIPLLFTVISSGARTD
jgi:hypothetical protein